jgi:hypothetical protein
MTKAAPGGAAFRPLGNQQPVQPLVKFWKQ